MATLAAFALFFILMGQPATAFGSDTAEPAITVSAYCPSLATITDTTPGAAIYYTTDGKTPSVNSTRYVGPFALAALQDAGTIQAIAIAKGYNPSTVRVLSFPKQVAAPSFFPLPGPYTVQPGPIQITSSASNSQIFVTTDGTIPTERASAYDAPMELNLVKGEKKTLSAFSVSGGQMSCVSQATYTYIPPSSSQSIASVSIDPSTVGAAIPADFAGLSLDHNEVARWIGPANPCGGKGQPSCAVNKPFLQLLDNLTSASGNALFVRIEGDGAMAPDNTNYGGAYYNNCKHSGETMDYAQAASASDPMGYSLLGSLKQLLENVDVKVSLGVDMSCDNPAWAVAEAANYASSAKGIGQSLWSKVVAFEIGNEPDNYASQAYRCSTYGFGTECGGHSYLSDWREWAGNLQTGLGSAVDAKFMGPSAAGSSFDSGILSNLGPEFNLSIVSQHNYPLPKQTLCTPLEISVGQVSACNLPDLLLQKNSVYGPKIGPTLYSSFMKSVHSKSPGTLYRMGEFNDIGGGGETGLSDTFQSALWLLDVEFLYASLGYDGTNIHTGEYTNYNLFNFTSEYGLQYVNPKYYALLAFERAAGNGARLLSPKLTTDANLTVWSTIDKNKVVHVVIINKDESATGTVTVTVPGYNSGVGQLLTAPSYASQCETGAKDIGCLSGVTLGGETFDGSTDGNMVAWAKNHSEQQCPLQPESLCKQAVTAAGDGKFTVTLPITSAIILDLQP